jgi:hypothetical protein
MQRAFAVFRPQVDLYAHKVVALLTEQASPVVGSAEERGARRAALRAALRVQRSGRR